MLMFPILSTQSVVWFCFFLFRWCHRWTCRRRCLSYLHSSSQTTLDLGISKNVWIQPTPSIPRYFAELACVLLECNGLVYDASSIFFKNNKTTDIKHGLLVHYHAKSILVFRFFYFFSPFTVISLKPTAPPSFVHPLP